MSNNYRSRGYSPPRYYNEQPRANSGAVYVTSFDTASGTGSSSASKQPRSSTSSVSSVKPGSVAYSAQPMRKSTFADGKTRTEYAIRPRNEPATSSDTRRPPSISTRNFSPPRRGPVVIASPREMTPVNRDDSSRLLQPASSHHSNAGHHRHNSTSMSDLSPREVRRDTREKSYHPRPPYVVRARVPVEDDYTYTGPREQFDHGHYRPEIDPEADRPNVRRETGPASSASRASTRRDRLDPDRYDSKQGFDSDPDRVSEAPKRRNSARPSNILHQQNMRDEGYSSAKDEYDPRGYSRHRNERYEDDVKPRERYRETARETDRDRERNYDRKYHRDPDRDRPRDYERDHERDHNRDYDRDRDRGYDRNYDRDYDRDYERDRDRDRDRDREDRTKDSRRKTKSREDSPERSGLKTLATSALSSLAAAGVVKGLTKDPKEKEPEPDSDEKGEKRHRKHRHRSRKDDQDNVSDRDSERHHDDRVRYRTKDTSSSETPDDQPSRRRHSHRPRRDDEESSDAKANAPVVQSERNSSKARIRDREETSPDNDRPSREMIPAHKQEKEPESLESRTISPGENEDDRPRRVQLVEPLKEKEEVKPKGILKPARQVPFPEDPNPIREGVAPLKDATKDGIPPNARWTKINRLLVNPAALDKAQERFEERDDYVIVLRVLSRDEIKKLANLTKEIRETREREMAKELEKSEHQPDEMTYSDGEIDYNRSEERSRRQLAIEPPPSAPPVDLHNLQSASTQQMPYRGVSGGPVNSEVNMGSNYSQNV